MLPPYDASPSPADDLATYFDWAEALTVDPVLPAVLRRRGVSDITAALKYLSPDLKDLTPPAEFAGATPAAEMLAAVCRRRGRVFVAGDYDVDGLCATALAVRALRAAGAEVGYAIPNRLIEGYDLSASTVERARAWEADVLLTVDCGVRAWKPVAAARAAGLAVIITDHHRLGDSLPAADAVVASALMPPHHPARGLAGVGVAYKVVAALADLCPATGDAARWLPLVALGTVCDVVDLTGENRILAAAGLKSFPGDSLPGLKSLLSEASLVAPTITAWHLSFVVGPRLNAAGRLGHAEFALSLLLTDDPRQARELAVRLETFNRERKRLEEAVAAEAGEQIAAQASPGRRSLVGVGAGWHTGVIGIVASQLAEKYRRPVVLISVEGDTGRGSCRSVPEFDIHAALTHLGARLIRFGGHSQAAGFEIKTAEIRAFQEELETYARDVYTPGDGEREDAIPLPLGAIDEGLVEDLELLEPTGQGNAEPKFIARTSLTNGSGRVFKNAHLEILADTPDGKMRGIGFNLARERHPLPAEGDCIVVYKPHVDRRGGVELKVTRLLNGGTPPSPPGAAWTDRRGGGIGAVAITADDLVYGLTREGAAWPEGEGFGFGQRPPRTAARVIVAHPPYNAAALAILPYCAQEVVLVYGDAEVRAVRDYLDAHFPDRDLLAMYYRGWREGVSEAPYLTEGGTARAIAVFRELGLIVSDEGGDRLAPLEGAKKSLASSPTFIKSQRRRQAGQAFVTKMATWPAEAIAHLAAGMTLSFPALTQTAP